MDKTTSLKADLLKAFDRLKEAVALPTTIINQDASIQRFEFTFELSWKLMSAILREQGISVYGPKNIIRESAKLGLIDNPIKWFEYLEARNLTVHTYKEELAKEVYEKAKEFVKEMDKFLANLKKYQK